jgi:uncharacterized OsmC-like protein
LTWKAETASTGIPGRAISRVRNNNFLVDDYPFPPYNGPGEEPGAGELFLAGVTTCAVLMVNRIARSQKLPMTSVRATMEGSRDTESPEQPPVLQSAHITFEFAGLTREQAGSLVETFKGK